MHYSVISDVKAVTTIAVGESAIDIQCLFIHGSDARGCRVELVSDYPSVNSVIMNISRNDMVGSAKFTLNQPVSCYNRVLAFDIEVNHALSNLTIEGDIMFQPRSTPNTLCSGTFKCIIMWR